MVLRLPRRGGNVADQALGVDVRVDPLQDRGDCCAHGLVLVGHQFRHPRNPHPAQRSSFIVSMPNDVSTAVPVLICVNVVCDSSTHRSASEGAGPPAALYEHRGATRSRNHSMIAHLHRGCLTCASAAAPPSRSGSTAKLAAQPVRVRSCNAMSCGYMSKRAQAPTSFILTQTCSDMAFKCYTTASSRVLG